MAAVEGGSPSDGDRSRPVPAVILCDNYGGPDTVEVSAGSHGEVGSGKTQQSSAGIAVLDDTGDNLVLRRTAFDCERTTHCRATGRALSRYLPQWDSPRCGQGPHQFTSHVISALRRALDVGAAAAPPPPLTHDVKRGQPRTAMAGDAISIGKRAKLTPLAGGWRKVSSVTAGAWQCSSHRIASRAAPHPSPRRRGEKCVLRPFLTTSGRTRHATERKTCPLRRNPYTGRLPTAAGGHSFLGGSPNALVRLHAAATTKERGNEAQFVSELARAELQCSQSAPHTRGSGSRLANCASECGDRPQCIEPTGKHYSRKKGAGLPASVRRSHKISRRSLGASRARLHDEHPRNSRNGPHNRPDHYGVGRGCQRN